MDTERVRRFSNRADFYARYRPGYPPGIVSCLRERIGFGRNDVVADVGSGTGLLAKVFLQNGNTVFGVEPNDEMRSHAERELAGFAGFVSVKGTAERTSLPPGSADLVTVGQALHWFDPNSAPGEFSRVLKERGFLCVAYNDRKDGIKFNVAYGRVARRNARQRARVPRVDANLLSKYFAGGEYTAFRLPNRQVLDFEGLRGLFLSASYMPAPGEEKRYARLMTDVRRLYDSYQKRGKVALVYETNVMVGRVPRPSSGPRRRALRSDFRRPA